MLYYHLPGFGPGGLATIAAANLKKNCEYIFQRLMSVHNALSMLRGHTVQMIASVKIFSGMISYILTIYVINIIIIYLFNVYTCYVN